MWCVRMEWYNYVCVLVYMHVNANADLCVSIWSGVYAYGGCVCA